MLTLSQLELALNPGAGGVGIYAGLNPKVSTDAIAEMKIFDLSEVDREPRPLVRIPPQYPPKLLLNRVSGRVDLLIVIDEEGRVTDHQVRRFTHNEFKREVTRVIRQWKFSPAMKDGRKVTVNPSISENNDETHEQKRTRCVWFVAGAWSAGPGAWPGATQLCLDDAVLERPRVH